MIPTMSSTRATEIPILREIRLDIKARATQTDASHQSCSINPLHDYPDVISPGGRLMENVLSADN
jgi:hypothetical protein